MKIVVWLSVLTEHQVHTLRALQSISGDTVEFVVGVRELEVRRQQGWPQLAFDELSVHELPKQCWWLFAGELLRKFPDAVHLFGGLWADRRFFPIMLRAQLAEALRQWIEREKLTQAQAAKRLGIAQPRVSEITRGKVELLSLDYLVGLCAKAGIPVGLKLAA